MVAPHPRVTPGVHITWRTPGTLYIELPDGSDVCYGSVPSEVARAARLLDGTRAAAAVEHLAGLDGVWIEWLLETLGEAGALTEHRNDSVAEVRGGEDLGTQIAHLLIAAGWIVVLHAPDAPHSPTATAGWTRADELRAECITAGGSPKRVWVSHRTSPVAGIVVLASERAECDRAETDELLRTDRPHIATSFVGTRAAVGPLIVPGVTACLRCADLAATQRDQDWPTRLAERMTRRARLSAPVRAWTAATVTQQVMAWGWHGMPDVLGTALELDSHDGRLHTRRWSAHPDCGCIAP